MDFLTRFGISNSRLTILVMIALIIQGLIAYNGLSKREDPAITIRTAVVSAQFPGMAPDRMEDLIVTPIERKAREIAEVDDINTLISTGSAVINLSVADSVPKDSVDAVFQEIRNKMEDLEEVVMMVATMMVATICEHTNSSTVHCFGGIRFRKRHQDLFPCQAE